MYNLEQIFTEAAEFADKYSTCRKVHVGACFVADNGNRVYACNNGGSSNCNELGYCYKAHVTGVYESTEETRKYCQSVHAEVNMLKTLREYNINPAEGVLFVTRYMCEACTKACLDAGIKHFCYCGRISISDNSKNVPQWIENANAKIEWYPEFDFEYSWKDIKFWSIFDIKSEDNLKHYIEFLSNVTSPSKSEYYEIHHIVPSCLGKIDNSQLTINLRPRDHFIAHRYLINCFNSLYNSKLAFAYLRMAASTDKQKSAYEVTGEEYEEARKLASEALIAKNAEFGCALTGRTLTEEHKKHIRMTHPDMSGEKNPFYGRKHTEESKQKMRASAKLRDPRTYNTKAMTAATIRNTHSLGRIWMNNNLIEVLIKPEDSGKYLEQGFRLGRLLSSSPVGTTWINNGKQNKRVPKKDINVYLKEGYVKGRLKHHKGEVPNETTN